MASGPEGNLNKRGRNTLTLKTALAALAIANSSPIEAQTTQTIPGITRQTVNERQDIQQNALSVEAKKTLNERREKVKEWRGIIGNTPHLQQEEKDIVAAEAALSDPRYLRGLEKIRNYGGNIEDVIARVPLETVLDSVKIDSALSRIPSDIIKNAQLDPHDFQEDPGYSYDRPGLESAAHQLGENGIRISIKEIHEMLDVEEKSPSFLHSFGAFITATHGAIHARNLMGSIRKGTITPEDLSNERATAGLLKMIQGGMELYNIVPDERNEESHADMLEKLTDPVYVERYLALRGLGYTPDSRTFHDLSRAVVENPNFLKNAALLRNAGVVSFSPENLKVPLQLDELELALKHIPDKKIYEVIYFLDRTGSDPEAWNTARAFYTEHSDDQNALNVLKTLDPQNLKSPSYMTILGEVIAKDKTDDPYQKKYDAERTFVQKETGKERYAISKSLSDYLSIIQNPAAVPLVVEILKHDESYAYAAPVLHMNELHDGSSDHRLEVIDGLNARVLFDVMVRAGADAYLSTFRLMYNGNGFVGPQSKNAFNVHVRAEYGSFLEFFRANKPDQKTFGTFLELLSQNDILDSFLSDIGSPEDQHTVLREFLFDGTAGIKNSQALALSDLLNSTKSDSIRDFVFTELRSIQNAKVDAKDRSPKIAGLLIADYFQGKAIPEWANESVLAYKVYFPEIHDLPSEKAFRNEGGVQRDIQLYLFYDDRSPGKQESTWDGHQSFKNFISSLGGSVEWDKEGTIKRITVGREYQIKDEGGYITVRQADPRTKREIVMYANKPDRNAGAVAEIGTELMQREKPQIVVHRGHSFHAGKTIALLQPDTAMVNLGSCGGAKNITDVLEKAPSAQVMATRGVGTMLVNDAVIPALNRALLRDGHINWEDFRSQMNIEFDRRGGMAKERWGSYQMPDKNRIAHLIAALKAIEK